MAGVTDMLLEGAAHAVAGRPRTRRGLPRHFCDAIARWFVRSFRSAGAAKLLASIDMAAREYRELCTAVGLLVILEPRATDRLVARRAYLRADP